MGNSDEKQIPPPNGSADKETQRINTENIDDDEGLSTEDLAWQYHPFFLNSNTLQKISKCSEEELDKLDTRGYIKGVRSMLYEGTAVDKMDAYRTQGNNALQMAKTLMTEQGRIRAKVSESEAPAKIEDYLDKAVSFYCEALKVPGIKESVLENVADEVIYTPLPETLSADEAAMLPTVTEKLATKEQRKEQIKKANESAGAENNAASDRNFISREAMNERLAIIHSNRSEALRMAKNYQAAMSDAIIATVLRKDWFRPYMRIGHIYEDTSDYFRAVGAYKKAYTLGYQNEVLSVLKRARAKLEDKKKGLKKIINYETEINNRLRNYIKANFGQVLATNNGSKNGKHNLGVTPSSITSLIPQYLRNALDSKEKKLIKFGDSLEIYQLRQKSINDCIYFDQNNTLTCDLYLCYPEFSQTDMINEIDVLTTKWSDLVNNVMSQVSQSLGRKDYSPQKVSFWYREQWTNRYEEYENQKGEKDIRIHKVACNKTRTEEDLLTIEELMENKAQSKRRWVRIDFSSTVWQTLTADGYIIPICPTVFVLPDNPEVYKAFFTKEDEITDETKLNNSKKQKNQ